MRAARVPGVALVRGKLVGKSGATQGSPPISEDLRKSGIKLGRRDQTALTNAYLLNETVIRNCRRALRLHWRGRGRDVDISPNRQYPFGLPSLE
jgi:hypothetical protein